MAGLTRRSWLAATGSAFAAAPAGYFDDLIAAMRVEWPRNEPILIAAHGHSVPAGYFKTPVVQSFDAYPHLFHVGLKQRFPHALINIVVTAKGGEDSEPGSPTLRTRCAFVASEAGDDRLRAQRSPLRTRPRATMLVFNDPQGRRCGIESDAVHAHRRFAAREHPR